MRIIDAHTHLFEISGYLEKLIETMDKCGIEKCCLSGLGKLFKCADNQMVKLAFKKYPNRIIGAYFIRPGVNELQDIEKAYSDGFRMIKVTLPRKPYDDELYFPLWEKAQYFKMPILFHTGIVTIAKKVPEERISSWFMHPMRIETIANSFPKLKIIIAHLGVHWNNDAAELIRMKKNVYADLSGAPEGWRLRADHIGMDHWLWWPGAFKKIVFGTDVVYNLIPRIIEEDMARLNKFNIDAETRNLIFAGNILKMLGEYQ
ncbi:MAG: amidohydrolase family protein [Promethearchaeota archaeon]